jgi:hypothetical protein
MAFMNLNLFKIIQQIKTTSFSINYKIEETRSNYSSVIRKLVGKKVIQNEITNFPLDVSQYIWSR